MVVIAYVEELYRSRWYIRLFQNNITSAHAIPQYQGIYQPGRFCILLIREQHIELVKLFDSRSSVYGVAASLDASSTPDKCAVLSRAASPATP
jgi:hypothetical protein